MKLIVFAALASQMILTAEKRTIVVISDIINPDIIGQSHKEYFRVFTDSFARALHKHTQTIHVPYDMHVILTLKKERDGVIIHINGVGNFKHPNKEFIRPFLGMKIAEPVILARAEVNGVIAADLVKKALMRDALKGASKKRIAGATGARFLLSADFLRV